MNVAELTTQYGATYAPAPAQPINPISPEQSLADKYGATFIPASQPTPETGYLGTAYNAITHSVDLAGQGGQQVAQGIKEGDIVKSLTGIARVGGGILSTIAAPFSALSAVVDKVPVLKPLNDLINATASIPGTVVQFPIDKAINSLPMTQEHKDLVHQATQEITSIGGQLWFFAKIGEGFGKGEVINKTKIDTLKEQANNLNEKITASAEPITPQTITDTYGATLKPAETPVTEPSMNIISQKIPSTEAVNIRGIETPIENKTSGVAKSIEAKAIEQGLINKGFDTLAGYDASTIKEQANIFSDILNNKGVEEVKAILRGEKSLPERARSGAFVVSTEAYLAKHPNADLAYELANSPHTSAFSQAGSELGLTQNRVQDSFAQKTEEIRKAREEQNPIKSSEIKTSIKTEMDKMNLSESDLGKLEKFIDNNIC